MLACCVEPKTIEEAKASLANLEIIFAESQAARKELLDVVANDICTLRRLISEVEAAQPTQSAIDAAFHFGG